MELAIDTSTNMAGVALSEEGEPLREISWLTKHNHTIELIPTIDSILKQQGATIGDLKYFIVAKGPGSFNGLRVGLSTAKGLSFPNQIPLVTIGTLETIAFAHAGTGLAVCPILNAGRNDISTALFQTQNGQWQKLKEEYISTVENLIAEIKSETILCGEIDAEKADSFKRALGPKAIFIEESDHASRVSCLCRLGWRRIKAGDFDDIRAVQPLYLKRPSITVPKKRRHDAMSSMRPRSK